MEKESLKLMNEVLLHVQCQNDEALSGWVETKFRQILSIEGLAKVKNKKFDLRDIAKSKRNEKWMPSRGILHEGGFEIATDGSILAMMKVPYDKELEGKNIDPKNGEEITDRKFPNYKLVINPCRFPDKVTLDFDAVKKVVQQSVLDTKLDQAKLRYYCKIGDSYYDMMLVKFVVRFMKAYSLTEIRTDMGSKMSQLYAEATDGSCILICPVDPDYDEVVNEAVDCNAA